jgi:hypothetical protein
MLIQLFHWKIWFTTNLAYWPFIDGGFLQTAAITIIFIFLRNLLKSITCKMKTSIALVTIQDLIRVAISRAKTYFTISLKQLLFVQGIVSFGRSQ